MSLKTILQATVVGLTLLGGIAGAANRAPSAHAAAGSQFCRYVSCYVAPSVTASSGNGELFIEGAHWAAYRWIELDIYAPVSSNLPSVTKQFVFTNKYGAFLDAYIPPGGCFYGTMEVQAIDNVSNTVVTTYGVPGCIS